MHTQAAQFSETDKILHNLRAKKALLWLGIVSIVMLFAAFTSGYIVRQGEGKWVQFELPKFFIVSTVLIVLSSIPMQWAVASVKRNNLKDLKIALLFTTLLGLGFVFFQIMAWSELFNQGIVFAGQIKDIKVDYTYVRGGNESASDIASMGNVAASFLWVITVLHVAHLLAGILVLFYVFSRALRGKYSALSYNGVSMCAIYWHFLDGLWVYLFFFLLYIR